LYDTNPFARETPTAPVVGGIQQNTVSTSGDYDGDGVIDILQRR